MFIKFHVFFRIVPRISFLRVKGHTWPQNFDFRAILGPQGGARIAPWATTSVKKLSTGGVPRITLSTLKPTWRVVALHLSFCTCNVARCTLRVRFCVDFSRFWDVFFNRFLRILLIFNFFPRQFLQHSRRAN